MKNGEKLIISIIVILFFFYLQRNATEDICEGFQREFDNSEFKGTIIKKFFAKDNHYSKSFLLEFEGDTTAIFLKGVNSMDFLYKNAELGDKIKKTPKNNKITLIKSNGVVNNYEVNLDCK